MFLQQPMEVEWRAEAKMGGRRMDEGWMEGGWRDGWRMDGGMNEGWMVYGWKEGGMKYEGILLTAFMHPSSTLSLRLSAFLCAVWVAECQRKAPSADTPAPFGFRVSAEGLLPPRHGVR